MAEYSKPFSLIAYLASLVVDSYLAYEAQVAFVSVPVSVYGTEFYLPLFAIITISVVGPVIAIFPDVIGVVLTVVDMVMQARKDRLDGAVGLAADWLTSPAKVYVCAGALMWISVAARLVLFSQLYWTNMGHVLLSSSCIFWMWLLSLILSGLSLGLIVSVHKRS